MRVLIAALLIAVPGVAQSNSGLVDAPDWISINGCYWAQEGVLQGTSATFENGRAYFDSGPAAGKSQEVPCGEFSCTIPQDMPNQKGVVITLRTEEMALIWIDGVGDVTMVAGCENNPSWGD